MEKEVIHWYHKKKAKKKTKTTVDSLWRKYFIEIFVIFIFVFYL